LKIFFQEVPQFNRQSILTDFEIVAKQGVKDVWPNVQLSSCYFHFRQILHRRIQNDGLVERYTNDAWFHDHMHALAGSQNFMVLWQYSFCYLAIALLEPNLVIDGYEIVATAVAID